MNQLSKKKKDGDIGPFSFYSPPLSLAWMGQEKLFTEEMQKNLVETETQK